MDFYEAQEQAHKKTKKLGFLFLLSVIFVMLAVGLLFVVLFYQGSSYLTPSGAQFSVTDLPWEPFAAGALIAGMTPLPPSSLRAKSKNARTSKQER